MLGLSAFIPIIYGVYLNGWSIQNQRMSIRYFLQLGLLHFTGASFYAARIPERWCPRKFDIYGASHQIMHLMVIAGAVSYAFGILEAFNYWHTLRLKYGDVCSEIQNS
jgi:adiponectin receptor